MISVLVNYGNASGFEIRGAAVDLFAAKWIRIKSRGNIALSESRRIESTWVKSRIYDGETGELASEVILNSAALRDSCEEYVEDATALGKEL